MVAKGLRGFSAYLSSEDPLEGREDFVARFPRLWFNHVSDGGNIGFRRRQLRILPNAHTNESAVSYCGHILEARSYAEDKTGIVISIETTPEAALQHPNRKTLAARLAGEKIWTPPAHWNVGEISRTFAGAEVLSGERLAVLLTTRLKNEKYVGNVADYWLSLYQIAGADITQVLWPT